MYTQISHAQGERQRAFQGDRRRTLNVLNRNPLAQSDRKSSVVSPWFVTFAMSALLSAMLLMLAFIPANAKTPGSTYCFYKKCHRVKTIKETRALVGQQRTLHASHYNACGRDRYNPCGLTSSGERFFPQRPDNAASPIYPDGTILLVWNERTQGAAVVRINNAGPYWGNRKLDVSIATARKLGFAHAGVAKLKTMILSAPTKREATYARHRNYRKVNGYLGKFESIEQAHRSSIAMTAIEAIAGSTGPILAGAVISASRHEAPQKQQQRTRVAKKAGALKVAMQASQTRWPDFAETITVPETELTPVVHAKTTLAMALTPPLEVAVNTPSQEDWLTVAEISPTPTQRLVLRHRPRTNDNSSIAKGEWAKLARPNLVLVRASDAGVSNVHEWLGRGRLGFTFQISGAQQLDRVSEAQPRSRPRALASLWTPDNKPQSPTHNLPAQHKVARAYWELT